MNLAVQLRVYRKSKGHSVQKVSELTGIPADRIYKWEKGTKPSDAEDLLKIREYMNGKVETTPKTEVHKLENGQASFIIAAEGKTEIAYLERLLEEKEARRLEAQSDKDRLFNSNETLARALDKLSSIYEKIADNSNEVKKNLSEILTNSGEALNRLEKILVVDRSDHKVTLASLDRLEHQPEGSNQKESNKSQLAIEKRLRNQNKDKSGQGKKDK